MWSLSTFLELCLTDGAVVKTLPATAFSIESGKSKLGQIYYPANAPMNEPLEERTLRLSSAINTENLCLVRALGGLVTYLLQASSENSTGKILVNQIEYLAAQVLLFFFFFFFLFHS